MIFTQNFGTTWNSFKFISLHEILISECCWEIVNQVSFKPFWILDMIILSCFLNKKVSKSLCCFHRHLSMICILIPFKVVFLWMILNTIKRVFLCFNSWDEFSSFQVFIIVQNVIEIHKICISFKHIDIKPILMVKIW